MESQLRINSIHSQQPIVNRDPVYTEGDRYITEDKTITDVRKSEMMVTAESNSVKVVEFNNNQQSQYQLGNSKGNNQNSLVKINQELRTEITKLNDEKCIMINKIFSLSKKYELMKSVKNYAFLLYS